MPEYFRSALENDVKAKCRYNKLTDAKKRYYLLWITNAKKEETRNRRIDESLSLLWDGKELGMR